MTPEKLKKLQRLAKVLDNGDIELLTLLDQIESKTEAEIQAIRATVNEALAVAETTKKLKGEKGEKGRDGYTPVKGVDYFDGEKGADGYTPIKGVDYFDGKDGYTPVKGKDYFDGKDGRDGVDGKDGADGFIDDATIGYLEDQIKQLEKKHGGYGQVIRKLRAGNNISINETNMEYPVITNTNPKITVSDTEPTSPTLNDIWIDTDAAPTGGGGAWGDITGTLSDQTDLQSVLDGKADALGADDNYVTDAEKTKLANLSGINTGDQDLSGYALTSHTHTVANITDFPSLATVATTGDYDDLINKPSSSGLTAPQVASLISIRF